MGLPVSLLLLAVGAVLAFAVHRDPNAAVNVHAVGWILMGVALVGLLLSLLWWERWGGGYWYRARGPYGDAGTRGAYPRRGYRGRRTVVEEDAVAPPADPYDAPPPP